MTLATTRRSDACHLLTMLHDTEITIKLALLGCLVHHVSNFLPQSMSYLWDLIPLFPYTPMKSISDSQPTTIGDTDLAWTVSFEELKLQAYTPVQNLPSKCNSSYTGKEIPNKLWNAIYCCRVYGTTQWIVSQAISHSNLPVFKIRLTVTFPFYSQAFQTISFLTVPFLPFPLSN